MKKIFSKIYESWELLVLNAWKLDKIMWKEGRLYMVASIIFTFFMSLEPFWASGALALLLNELSSIATTSIMTTGFYLVTGLLVLSIVVPPLLATINSYFEIVLYWLADRQVNLMIIKKNTEIDIASHEDPKFKDLFNRLGDSGAWASSEFLFRQFSLLEMAGRVIIASSVLFWANWKIFLLIFLATIPELINGIYYGGKVWGIADSKAETKRRYWDIKDLFSNVSSLVEINLFQNSKYFYEMVKKMFDDFKIAEKKNEVRNSIYQFVAVSISQIALAVAVVFYVLQAANGLIAIGTLTFIIYSAQSLKESLSRFFWMLSRQYKDGLFVKDFFTFLSIKSTIKKPEKGIILDKKIAPEIVFDNVSFAYPGTDRVVLKNFSFTIKPGEKIALVGLNGAGKTTFVKLLCRFYDPTEGRILINGHDLREIDVDSWYHILGAVFQDYSRYHLTVKEAIAVGRTGDKPDIEKVKDAAKAGEADIFIEKWEQAYEQTLGRAFTGGVEPSVGQWQKLALARVFYRDPRVMILDEPTSSIDALSESKIFEKIGEVSDNRSIVLISHRFSTVRKAHKIVVIKDGEKLEEGTHEELIAKKGTYAELYQLQAKSYE
jgi:ATP-binding cassette subfamily B protein